MKNGNRCLPCLHRLVLVLAICSLQTSRANYTHYPPAISCSIKTYSDRRDLTGLSKAALKLCIMIVANVIISNNTGGSRKMSQLM